MKMDFINRFRIGAIMLLSLNLFNINFSAAQDDPKKILEKCFVQCMNLPGGTYTLEISKKTYNQSRPDALTSACEFLRVEGDSVSPYKFLVSMGNGDKMLCTSNDFVQINASKKSGTIYSRSNNQSIFRGACQAEGLFPPFFQPRVIFTLDRFGESTFIVRKGKDETALGNPCYSIKVIDLIRASLPDGQRQEKTFLIDKKTFLPVFYSEKTALKLNDDSVFTENSFKLTSLSSTPPHDSVFTYKAIPAGYVLRNILEEVYHHHLKPGIEAPAFRAKQLLGDSVDLISFRGKKVVLFFFHRTSYPSLKALNGMQQFQNTHKDVEVLLIAVDASEDDLSALLNRRNISLKAFADAQYIADDYFITSAPAFVFIDEKGVITELKNGYGEGMENTLK